MKGFKNPFTLPVSNNKLSLSQSRSKVDITRIISVFMLSCINVVSLFPDSTHGLATGSLIAQRYDYDNTRNPYMDDEDDESFRSRKKIGRNNHHEDDEETVDESRRHFSAAKPKPNNFNNIFKNQKRTGAIFIGAGAMLTFLGIMLFFEGNLLRLGNISFLIGVTLLVGPNRLRSYFLQSSRMRATIIVAIGIFLVFSGRPRLGIILEVFGLLNLYGNMFPVIIAMARNLPVVGDIITSFEGDNRNNNNNKSHKKRPSYSTQF